MSNCLIVGIDPGQKGGIATYDALGDEISIKSYPMPLVDKFIDCRAIVNAIGVFNEGLDKVLIVIEKVHAMPKQGVTSMFTFGRGYGQLIGMCQCCGWKFMEVIPQRWKKLVLGPDRAHDKEGAILFAKEHYPDVSLLATARCKKPHDGMADALALMHYGRLVINNGG